jgi:hypothetical protein
MAKIRSRPTKIKVEIKFPLDLSFLSHFMIIKSLCDLSANKVTLTL